MGKISPRRDDTIFRNCIVSEPAADIAEVSIDGTVVA
jgi:hypothetical protein